MMEKMAVIVFPVCITRQSEESWNRHDENCRTVKRIDVPIQSGYWISDKRVTSHREN